MRIVLFLMILSLGFSGFSAASHAFSDMKAAADISSTMEDCPDHAQKSDDHEHSKGLCLDCHHCCASHAVTIPSFTLSFADRDDVLNPLPADDHAGRQPASLLRPPKSLV